MKFRSVSELLDHLQEVVGPKTPRRIAAFITDYLFLNGYARFYYDKNLNFAGVILGNVPWFAWERARSVALGRFNEWAYNGEGARPSAISAVAGMLKAGTITEEEFSNFVNSFDKYNKESEEEIKTYKISDNSDTWRQLKDELLQDDNELRAGESDCQGS
jgi:hypothetical protein